MPRLITAGAKAAPIKPVRTTAKIVIDSFPPNILVDSTAMGVVIDLDNSDKNIISSTPNNLHKTVIDANVVIMLAITPPIIGIKFFINSCLFL